MPRAYLRLDPSFDERKEAYPDGPYAALVATLCLAEHQPHRGRFRSRDYLQRLLGRRGRHLAYLIEHGDLVTQEDGRVYVDGWDEWQEGDWKVAERVARIRSRKKPEPITLADTPHVTVQVTPDVTPSRYSGSGSTSNSGATAEATRPPEDDIEGEAITWLARHGCYVQPSSGYYRHLVTMVEAHGINAVIGMFDRLASIGVRNGDVKGFVFGAKDALDERTRPDLKAVEKEDRQEEQREVLTNRVTATKVRIHEAGGHSTASPGCPRCDEGAA